MSSFVRDPILTPVTIESLRPTQITVGLLEVDEKRKDLRKRGAKKIGNFLGDHMIPVVLGPRERHFIIDHHHLSLALHKEGVEKVLVTVVADLSELAMDEFWIVLDHKSWVHPYDEEGRRRDFAKIPKSVDDLKDDPFRSLAGEMRRAGAFAKDTTPFSEFLWADFLRRRLKRSAVEKNFKAAVKEASVLAKSKDARYLPGWCGPV
ncbi:MAG TPA: ParB-like protein [Pseudolabrys sp.]